MLVTQLAKQTRRLELMHESRLETRRTSQKSAEQTRVETRRTLNEIKAAHVALFEMEG